MTSVPFAVICLLDEEELSRLSELEDCIFRPVITACPSCPIATAPTAADSILEAEEVLADWAEVTTDPEAPPLWVVETEVLDSFRA